MSEGMEMSSTTSDTYVPTASTDGSPSAAPRGSSTAARLSSVLSNAGFLRALNIAEIFYQFVAAALLVVGTVGVVVVLLLRNLGGSEPAWTVEGYTLALVMGGILFIGDVSRHIGYSGLTPLTKRIPRLTLLVQVLFQSFVYIMIVLQGIEVTKMNLQTGVHTPSGVFPLWIVYVTVPVVGIRGVINVLQQIVKHLTTGVAPTPAGGLVAPTL